jgi:hypothetical protein
MAVVDSVDDGLTALSAKTVWPLSTAHADRTFRRLRQVSGPPDPAAALDAMTGMLAIER